MFIGELNLHDFPGVREIMEHKLYGKYDPDSTDYLPQSVNDFDIPAVTMQLCNAFIKDCENNVHSELIVEIYHQASCSEGYEDVMRRFTEIQNNETTSDLRYFMRKARDSEIESYLNELLPQMDKHLESIHSEIR